MLRGCDQKRRRRADVRRDARLPGPHSPAQGLLTLALSRARLFTPAQARQASKPLPAPAAACMLTPRRPGLRWRAAGRVTQQRAPARDGAGASGARRRGRRWAYSGAESFSAHECGNSFSASRCCAKHVRRTAGVMTVVMLCLRKHVEHGVHCVYIMVAPSRYSQVFAGKATRKLMIFQN